MAEKHEPETDTPWYLRGKALIIGAGALAAALLGVVNLWEKVFPEPTEDLARIESIHIIKRTPLTGFAPGGIGKDLPLTPIPDAAAVGGAGSLYLDRVIPGTLPADPGHGPGPGLPVKPLFTSIPKPTLGPLPTATLSPSPTPTGTGTSSPTPTSTTTDPTVSPTPTTSPTTTLSPTPSASTTSAGGLTLSPTAPTLELLSIPRPVSDETVSVIAAQPPMQKYPAPAREYVARSLVIEAVNDEGEPLPPAEVAQELAQALEQVEATTGPDGEDPQGWTLAVRVDLEGLADVPLLLTWSLDGLDVPETWQADNLAYRVVGATPHDAGVAEIWVPDLKRPGAYNVNIKLSYESTGLIADLRPIGLPDSGVIQGGG